MQLVKCSPGNCTTLTCDPSTCIDDDGYIWVGMAYHLGQVALETLYQTEVLVRIILRRSCSKIICPEEKKNEKVSARQVFYASS